MIRTTNSHLTLFAATALSLVLTGRASAQQTVEVLHKTVKVGDLDIFYREAGPKDAPAVLLLHGFPTSSQMFRNLIPALADKYHVVAPDYPGYGHSSMPPHDKFAYTFDNLAKVIDEFTEKLGLTKYALYVQDYGAPVGYRLAVKHPERITAIVVQNGNAYDEGLDNDFWKPIKAYWKEPNSKEKRDALRGLLTYEATKWQYTHGVKNPRARQPGRGGPRPVPARPQGERRDPARPVPQLRQQPAAVPEVAGVFPQAPAADVDRVGEERPDLPARRGRAVQARPEDAGVPPARRRPLRPGNERRRDRQADAGVPRQACDEAVSPGVLRAWRRRFRRFLRCTNTRATSSSRPR